MSFTEKERLKIIYDREIETRRNHPSKSRVYSGSILEKHPDLCLWTFGCSNLLPFLKEEFSGKSPIEIMDFGCGAGSDLALYCRELNIASAVGIDISTKMLQQAAHLCENIEWILGDHADLVGVPRNFDCVTTNAVIHLMQDKLSVIQNLHHKLKESGILLSAEFVTKEPLPKIFRDHYLDSDGLFLFGGLVDRKNYLDFHFQAGFEEVEILKTFGFDPKSEIENLLSQSSLADTSKMREALPNIEFQIIVVRALKTVSTEVVSFQCPYCSRVQIFPAKFYRSLNTQIHKFLVKNLHKTQWTNCEDCKTSQFVAPFQIHDMHRQKMAFCFPIHMLTQKELLQQEILEKFQQRLPNYQMALCFEPDELSKFLPLA